MTNPTLSLSAAVAAAAAAAAAVAAACKLRRQQLALEAHTHNFGPAFCGASRRVAPQTRRRRRRTADRALTLTAAALQRVATVCCGCARKPANSLLARHTGSDLQLLPPPPLAEGPPPASLPSARGCLSGPHRRRRGRDIELEQPPLARKPRRDSYTQMD